MDTGVVVAAISASSAVICGALVWRSSGRATAVDRQAADLEWVKEIKQDAVAARKEVDALTKQVRTLSAQMDAMAKETDYWIAQYQLVHRTVWRPGMTLDRVRQFIGPEPPPTPATS